MLSQKGILAISTTMAAAALAIAISTAAYVANQPEDTGKRLDFTEKEPTIVGNEEPAGLPTREPDGQAAETAEPGETIVGDEEPAGLPER